MMEIYAEWMKGVLFARAMEIVEYGERAEFFQQTFGFGLREVEQAIAIAHVLDLFPILIHAGLKLWELIKYATFILKVSIYCLS